MQIASTQFAASAASGGERSMRHEVCFIMIFKPNCTFFFKLSKSYVETTLFIVFTSFRSFFCKKRSKKREFLGGRFNSKQGAWKPVFHDWNKFFVCQFCEGTKVEQKEFM
jgi:hypothetical protein